MSFDTPIDRIGTHCQKWDEMEMFFGLSPQDSLAMWVADMEFRPPQVVQAALEKMTAHGVYGYFGDDRAYRQSITWWMQTRHGWTVDPAHIFTSHGLVNGLAICIDALTAPGDGVVLMAPVYHAFARIIRAAGRQVVECPLALVDGRYQLDIDAWDAQMTGQEKLLILCSPHNPGGRVWTPAELRAVTDFAQRHGLLVISDEIHHDLVYPGERHHVTATVSPEIADRLVTLTATSKTFNIAGIETGNVIIADAALRKRFADRHAALGITPNAFGMNMVTAAYSPAGAVWVDRLMAYLDGNRALFDSAMNALPGVRSMKLEATYLAWVDFRGTGMSQDEIIARVHQHARIATNPGPRFGTGGEGFLRVNLAAPKSQVVEAVSRLTRTFADLQ